MNVKFKMINLKIKSDLNEELYKALLLGSQPV